MTIRTRLAALAMVMTGALAAPVAAQEIVLYDLQNFGGQSVSATGTVSNLDPHRFNDRASSIQVVSGTWELCVHANFGGECVIFNGNDPDLGRFSNQFSSLRPVAAGHGSGSGYGGGSRGAITFYSGPNFTGRSVTLDHAEPNFQRIGFNDEARSIRFSGRRSWRVCQHANYGGACMEVNGDLPHIGGGMSGEISSAEPDTGVRGFGSRPHSGVWLYDGRNFDGQRVEASYDTPDMDRLRFNDRADSIVVALGEVWEVCQHDNYRGRCEIIDGDTDLSRIGMHNTISSLRRVNGGGYGGGGYGGGYSGQVQGGVRGVNAMFFPRPEINGHAVDRCLGYNRRDCGDDTAERICRAAGYRDAVSYGIDRYNRTRTWHLGDNRECRTGSCEAIVDVLCAN